MKLNNISPSLYNFSYFKYVDAENKYPKISFEKSQYVYRIISVAEGSFDVLINGKKERLEAGDAVYLLPGEVYRILPRGEDFSIYNLFFDFFDIENINDNRLKYCAFMEGFNFGLCLSKIDFEDAPILNNSGIFKKLFENDFKLHLYTNRGDAISKLYQRSTLISIIADILSKGQDKKVKSTVRKILEYIISNPEEDLSGDKLSALFSYHKNHINKLIRSETGKSLNEYVRSVKIEYAKKLLLEEGYSLSEVSMKLGFYDYSHFYKAFRKETGTIPTEYIKLF